MLLLGVSVKSSKFWSITRMSPNITDVQSGLWLHLNLNKIRHNIRLHDIMVKRLKRVNN